MGTKTDCGDTAKTKSGVGVVRVGGPPHPVSEHVSSSNKGSAANNDVGSQMDSAFFLFSMSRLGSVNMSRFASSTRASLGSSARDVRMK
jgi:hypothetical protein